MGKKCGMSSVRILGAGPAGLSAAIALARAGVAVEVFERRGDCGDHFQGDLQGVENFSVRTDFLEELADHGLKSDFICSPFSTVKAYDPDRRAFDLSGDGKAIFYLVQRGKMPLSIDQSLKRQALAAGVQIRFHSTLPPEDVDIVATGTPSREVRAVAYGMFFETDHPDAAYVLLDNRLAYRGHWLPVLGPLRSAAASPAAICFGSPRAPGDQRRHGPE